MIPIQIDVKREKRFERAVKIGNIFHLHDPRRVNLRTIREEMRACHGSR
jgi:hypothetical protein